MLYPNNIFVWIQHDCSANIVFVLDPNNSVIKRLRCTIHLLGISTYVLTWISFTSLPFLLALQGKSEKFLSAEKWQKTVTLYPETQY